MDKIIESKTTLNNVDIENTMFSGQCFRWDFFEKRLNIIFGIIKEDLFIIEKLNSVTCTISSTKKFDHIKKFDDFNRNYFSLDTNVKPLFPAEFKERYSSVWELIQPYLRIKILRQDPFETLITFMCAQGLGMQLIRKQASYLARKYGIKHTVHLNNKPLTYFSFPAPETLAATNPEDLRLCTNNNCTRAQNIITAAQDITSGKLDLETLKNPDMPLDHVRQTLCRQPGIGFKIADCIMLFGLHRFSAFPIDRHVHQYLAIWFSIGEALQSLSQKHYLFLQEQACRLLKPELAGFAGHILFHCWRKEIKHLQSY